MAGGETGDVAPKRKSDLGVRTLSAIVMLVVAGGALWLGGWFWAVFVALVSMGVLWEWRGLARAFSKTVFGLAVWNVAGFIYIATAAFVLLWVRSELNGGLMLLLLVGAVVATDIGAYFAGRTIGGPKIAPKISPSKTWAGLAGGICGAALLLFVLQLSNVEQPEWVSIAAISVVGGAIIAVVAQAGDFFESWMKRRAGTKDSGALLPGHGGLFDRADGLLAVLFVFGIFGGLAEWWPNQSAGLEIVRMDAQ